MNRDALLATLIGLALGLTITGVLIVGPNVAKSFPKLKIPWITWSFLNKSSDTARKTAPTAPAKTPVFTLVSPLPDAIETNNQLVVSGTAEPKAMVVISGLTDDDVVLAGNDGQYVGKITLEEGKNDITVTRYLEGKPSVQKVTVYYTQESI